MNKTQFLYPLHHIVASLTTGISQDKFGVRSIRNNRDELTAAVYLQVSIVSQALIFVTRSRSWSYVERPGLLLVTAFVVAQLVWGKCCSESNTTDLLFRTFCWLRNTWIVYKDKLLIGLTYQFIQIATILAVYANWGFAKIHGIGWGWAGVVWLYSIIFYIPLDILKFFIRYSLSGRAWDNLLQNKVAI